MAQILLNLHGSGIILTAAIMLISGFLFTRLTKLAHLPNVTGYIPVSYTHLDVYKRQRM